MKRKIFGFLSLALTVVVGASLMGSCKDYDEDQYDDLIHRLADQDKTLSDKINQNVKDLQDQIDALKIEQSKCKQNCGEKFQLIQMSIDSLREAILGVGDGTTTNLVTIMTGMNERVASAAATAKAAQVTSDSIAKAIVGWGDSLRTAYQNAADAYALAVRDSIRIDALEAENDEQQAQIDSLAQITDSLFDIAAKNLQEAKDYADMADSILREELLDSVDVRIAEIEEIMAKADSILQDQIDTLNAHVDALADRMDAVEDAIEALEDEVADVTNAVNKMITNITINGAINPVYGSFAWPVGIRSNMLIAYYGEFSSSVKFPTTQTGHLVGGCVALDAKDAELLGTLDQNIIAAGTIVSDSADNAGKVLFTINPNTADLEGDEFTLVNSQGVESKAVFGEVVPSKETLAFGSTNFMDVKSTVNGTSANSFYEAPVKVTAEAVPSLKVNLDDALKDAVKNVLDLDRPDLHSLASGIYRQFNNVFEANAIKATWTDSLGSHSTWSNYDLAVAAVKPLSYHTLYGTSLAKLPTITPLGNVSFNVGSISGLDFSTINFNVNGIAAHISFGTVTINSTGTVQVTVQKPTAYNNTTGIFTYADTTYTVQGLNSVLSDVETALNSKVSDWETSVNGEIDSMISQIQSSINSEVNRMLNEVSGQLTDKVNDMLNDVQNSVTGNLNDYIGKLNKIIDKVNAASNRVNSYLTDVNSKLQVVMFYQDAKGDFRNMSTSASLPAIFNGTGSIVLYPTSWTADIAVPSYQKFVAVTDVINGSASARNGDATCVSVLKNTNDNNEYLNTVIEGGRYGITFTPAASGYTYEIVYSAVDYQGWISTRKFYVTVK